MDEQKEEKKCECGMPLNDQTTCSSDPEKCKHCCSCPEGPASDEKKETE